MKGLSLVGLLITLGIVGFLLTNQLKSSSPETGGTAPTEAIDKANEAADTVENQAEQLQNTLNQQAE